MNHQVQNLTGFCLELERFDIRCHDRECNGECRGVQAGGRRVMRPPVLKDGSRELVEECQDACNFFDDCQRSKSAPRMKNFRPICTIRMRSSSMILRKW